MENTFDPTGLLLADLLQAAINAHHWTSFDPQRRGETLIKDHSEELRADLAGIEESAKAHGIDAARLDEARDRFTAKYRQNLTAWIGAKSNCASSMITGPSNFNVARNRKANDREQNRYEDFRAWRQRALQAIDKSFRPPVTAQSEAERYEEKLSGLLECHEMMKRGNQIIRKGGPDVEARLIEAGFSAEHASQLVKPDVMGNIGFANYALSNNLATIKATKLQLARAKSRLAEVNSGAPAQELDVNGVRIVRNSEADRVQIFFPGKPSPAMISTLKKAAFKWAPSVQAWQRQLTNNAIDATERIIGVIREAY